MKSRTYGEENTKKLIYIYVYVKRINERSKENEMTKK